MTRSKDQWQWKVIVSDSSNSRYKCGGINFVDGKVYWISDANGPRAVRPRHLPLRPGRHRQSRRSTRCCSIRKSNRANMIIQDGVILASHCAPASPMATGIIVSLDLGKTWAQYDLKEFGKRSPIRFHEKNSEGWFRVDLRSGWIERAEVMFIKPKHERMTNDE